MLQREILVRKHLKNLDFNLRRIPPAIMTTETSKVFFSPRGLD
jgi:hypothetical protein